MSVFNNDQGITPTATDFEVIDQEAEILLVLIESAAALDQKISEIKRLDAFVNLEKLEPSQDQRHTRSYQADGRQPASRRNFKRGAKAPRRNGRK